MDPFSFHPGLAAFTLPRHFLDRLERSGGGVGLSLDSPGAPHQAGGPVSVLGVISFPKASVLQLDQNP